MKIKKTTLFATAAALAVLSCSTVRAQGTPQLPGGHPALPAGHPAISQTQAGGPAPPAGHPAIDQGNTTQPAFGGAVKIHAVQGTPGGPVIGAEPVVIELYSRGQPLDTTTGKLGADGTLTVNGLPLKFDVQAVARVTHNGVVFTGVTGAIDPDHPTQSVDVPVYETTTQRPDWSIIMRHVMVHDVPQGLQVDEMLLVNSPADHAWIGGADKVTMQIALTSGATDLKVGGGLVQQAVTIVDGKLVSRQPMLPGQDRYQLEYTIPAVNGSATLNITAPGNTGHALIFLPDDGTALSTNGLQAMGTQKMDESGAKTRYFMAPSMSVGQTVGVTVNGIKAPAPAVAAPQAAAPVGPVIAPPAPAATQQAAMVAPPVSPTQTPPPPMESESYSSSNLPKVIAAAGAAVILTIGGLFMLVKKPSPPVLEVTGTKARKAERA